MADISTNIDNYIKVNNWKTQIKSLGQDVKIGKCYAHLLPWPH